MPSSCRGREAIYYERQHNGYHGGATPQEMVCPLVILRDKSSAYSGLFPCEYPKPEWWSSAPVNGNGTSSRKLTVPVSPKATDDPVRRHARGNGGACTDPDAEARPCPAKDWIKRLLASQAYKDQKEMIRRHAPEDALVQSSLEALDANGGIMTPAAFAKAADLPPARLDGADRPDETAAERGWL